MQTMKEAAAEFLAAQRVAVTGVSRNPKGHGSNIVYQRLRERRYQVFAVKPQGGSRTTAQNPAISKLAVWEPPYRVDDSAPDCRTISRRGWTP